LRVRFSPPVPRKENTMNSNICKTCGISYDIEETVRVYGDMLWTDIYCSPQCYTKALTKKQDEQKIIYLVIRHMGEWDDYTTTALAAFKDEAKAKTYCINCNEEVKRIRKEMKILETEYEDIFIIGEREETDEEIEAHGKKSLEFSKKQIEIYDSHLYDTGIQTNRGLDYQFTEIKLY
jgi:hypothetical protein